MKQRISFKDYVIVSCGTLAPELNYLKKQEFLDAKKIFSDWMGIGIRPDRIALDRLKNLL